MSVWNTINKWLPEHYVRVGEDDPWEKTPNYMGSPVAGHPPLNTKMGLLTFIGFHNDYYSPLRVQCDCGRQINMSMEDFTVLRSCGCYYDTVRVFHLIRMRWELLRFFLSMAPEWFKDMEELQKHVAQVDSQNIKLGEATLRRLYRHSTTISPEDIASPRASQALPMSDFWKLYAIEPETLRKCEAFVEGLQALYPVWQASEVLSLEGFETVRDDIPEFDQHTYLSFIKYLHENVQPPQEDFTPTPSLRWASLTAKEIADIRAARKLEAEREQGSSCPPETEEPNQVVSRISKIFEPIFSSNKSTGDSSQRPRD